jgi:hypothetical protein
MMDANSVGRLTALSPVTWKDGWPYFGLPGNLGRTPRIWVKPNTARKDSIHPPYVRSDDFSGTRLNPIWQWNHVPVDEKWSLRDRPGFLRLHAMPADSLWSARNTLTQRAVGPRSAPTVTLETAGMKPGDAAGLALFNRPYAWLAVERGADGLSIVHFDEQSGARTRIPFSHSRVWLRANCDFLNDTAQFSYSADGETFSDIGEPYVMAYGLITFQGIRYSLFSYNTRPHAEGGFADFDSIAVAEPHPRGLTRAIPYGRRIWLEAHDRGPAMRIARYRDGLRAGLGDSAAFLCVDRGLGRVALETEGGFASVSESGAVVVKRGQPGSAETFQWMETFTGELILMSLRTNRYLGIDPETGHLFANSAGPLPSGDDGVRFDWSEASDAEQR